MDLLGTGGDGRIAQVSHDGLAFQGQPLGVKFGDTIVVVLDSHIIGLDDIRGSHHSVENGDLQSIIIHSQGFIHSQGHSVGSILQGVGSRRTLGDCNGRINGGGGILLITCKIDADTLSASGDSRPSENGALFTFQSHILGICLGKGFGVVGNGHIVGSEDVGRRHHSVEDGIMHRIVVHLHIFIHSQDYGIRSLLQSIGSLSPLGDGDVNHSRRTIVCIVLCVGDADLLIAGRDGGVVQRNADGILNRITFKTNPLVSASGPSGNYVLSVILNGHIVHGQIGSGGGHYILKDSGPQGIIVHLGALVVRQGNRDTLVQSDGRGALGLLVKPYSFSGITGQPDLVAAVFVGRQGGVSKRRSDKHYFLFTGKSIN